MPPGWPRSFGHEPVVNAITEVWNAHQGELFRFVRARVGDADEAHDVVQEVFVRVLRQPGGLAAIDNPRAWLFQAARNLLIDRFRLTREQVPLPDDLVADTGNDSDARPVDTLTRCLPHVLSVLTVEDRDAITLCDLEGITQQAYAARSGLTLPAAKARVRRARQRLRLRLVELCGVRFDARGEVCCFSARSGASTSACA